VRLINLLEREIWGWNRIYTVVHQDARRHWQYHVTIGRMLEIETKRRMTAEEKLLQVETELQKLQAEKAEWERKEKGYLTAISKLEDKVTDRKAECQQLQN
jgi:hypothetical protein